MAVRVTIPTALRQYTGGQAAVMLEAGTVGQVLTALAEQHPQIGKQLFDDDLALRRFVNIYLGDEDIRYLQGVDTPVPDGGELSIIPAIAGGWR